MKFLISFRGCRGFFFEKTIGKNQRFFVGGRCYG
jgi:hypothetical protein